jgi:hypothetical protein
MVKRESNNMNRESKRSIITCGRSLDEVDVAEILIYEDSS